MEASAIRTIVLIGIITEMFWLKQRQAQSAQRAAQHSVQRIAAQTSPPAPPLKGRGVIGCLLRRRRMPAIRRLFIVAPAAPLKTTERKDVHMPAKVQVSGVIDRPVAKVFHFVADEHVRNHPRWDPDMKLEQVTEGPMGVGTMIKRVNSRSGKPVEGTMEVVEFVRNQAMGMIVHDGPVEMRGRTTFEAAGDNRTTITFNVEIPSMDESFGTMLSNGIQRSIQNIKRLIESEA